MLIERIPGGLDTDTVHLVRGSKDLGEFKVQDIQEVCLDRIKIIV